MTDNAMSDLLPCPFCGGDARLHDNKQELCVLCYGCEMEVFGNTADECVAAWNRRTPPTPATDERDAVARAISTKTYALLGSSDDCGEWEEMSEKARNVYRTAADAALSALAPIRAAEILAAEANERARIEADLKDPQIVHMNMLRGGIAKINVTQAMHLNGWTSIDNWHRMTVEQIEAAVKARNEHGAGK